MEQGENALVIIGMALFALFAAFLGLRETRRWDAQVNADFQTALKALQIETHELLVDRTLAPSPNTIAEVYRILRDQDGRYFLYIRTADGPGVIKPLTEERALLAAKMSSYGR